jgi:hypothetical protein
LKLISLFLAVLMTSVSYAGANDQGIISELYVDDAGNMAIQLENGFPQAVARSECATNNGWAGVTIDAPELKSVLLAAKATQSLVTVSIYGCASNGAWFNVRGVYVK